MQFHTVAGKRPEVCLWQLGTDGCGLAPRAPITDAWTTYEQFITIDTVATGLQVVLYANVGVRLGERTVTEYRDISIEALDPISRTTVFPAQVPNTSTHLTAGTHTIAIAGGPSGSALQPFGPLEDCYNTDDSGFQAAGLSATKLANQTGPAFRLTAKDHRACIEAAVPDMGNSSLYELSFEARSVNLRDPRVCLYQRGPDRCSTIPTGGPWKTWNAYRVLVPPDPTSVETRLYLYGLRDISGTQQAVVEYRNIALRPLASAVDVTLVRQQASAPPATTTWKLKTPTTFTAALTGATPMQADGTGTVLSMFESSAPGWRPEGATGLAANTHPKVQGWMNGWVASASTVSATLYYTPDKIAQIALKILPVALLSAILWMMVRRPVRAAVTRGRRRLGRCIANLFRPLTRRVRTLVRRHPTAGVTP
jgi:arabinofuranan 3-O-arabinosyltransferase